MCVRMEADCVLAVLIRQTTYDVDNSPVGILCLFFFLIAPVEVMRVRETHVMYMRSRYAVTYVNAEKVLIHLNRTFAWYKWDSIPLTI